MNPAAPGRPRPPAIVVITALLAAAALLAGCSGAPQHAGGSGGQAGAQGVPAASPGGPGPTTLAGYYHQKLRWQPCHGRFQCARLLVPFDYQRPGWRRFSLPVARLPAAGPGKHLGSLVVNPGGPGGSGISYVLQPEQVASSAVRARFDLVGFDPRGVGGSVPAIRCLSDQQLDKYLGTSDSPATPAQLATVVSESRLFAHDCQLRSGPLLRYVGTKNAARDMDVLRAALGDAKLTYLGKSYGTYLGAWYAQQFPSRVRALVLDGAVDPQESAFVMNTVQAKGFQVALRSFTASCLRMTGCALGQGGSVAAAIGRLRGLLNRAQRKPLASQIPGQPGVEPLLLNGVAAALYSKSYWRYLRTGLANAFRGDGSLLVALGDSLVERNRSGHYSNLIPAETAVNCVDRPWPRPLARWKQAAAAAARSAPLFGAPNTWSSLPCAYWPVRAAPVPKLTASGAPPILVVGTTRDPATPFRWARALAGDLSSGVLLGWNGDGHTAYLSGSSCVDSAVDRYVISQQLPRSGTVCG